MALTIKVRRAEAVVVIEMTGRLVIGQPVDDLRETICRLLDDGHRLFVLNLAGITAMDSVGLGQTISAYVSVRDRGGRIVLSSPCNARDPAHTDGQTLDRLRHVRHRVQGRRSVDGKDARGVGKSPAARDAAQNN